MIHIREIHKSFRRQAVLRGVSLQILPGEITALIGKNGSGKSTLVQAIAGLISVDAGTVLIDEVPIGTRYHAVLRRVGFVFDQPIFVEGFSALYYLNFVGMLYGLEKKASQHRAMELVEFFDLPTDRKKIADYSKGMKKKVSLAGALVHKPAYLILDEPFDGMDEESVFKAGGMIRHLVKEGTGVLLVSHQNHLIQKLAEKVAKLEEGKIMNVQSVQSWQLAQQLLLRDHLLGE